MKIQQTNIMIEGYKKRKKHDRGVIIILIGIVFLLACFMMSYGNTIYSLDTVVRVLLGEEVQGATFTIRTLRLPRMLAAILCGYSFGMAGNIFQKLLGNPLASPDVIGISSGTSVAAVFGILILGWSGTVVSIMAVGFGLFVAFFIYFLSQGTGNFNGRLILVGIGTQAFLQALLSWMLVKTSEYNVSSALHWLSGSLNGIKLENVRSLAVVVLSCSLLLFFLKRHLEILQLGEEYAKMLGISMSVTRLLFMFLSLFLIAFSTSVSGPLVSVAFLSGPIATKLSSGRSSNMFVSALVGVVLVLLSDIIGQFFLPARYPAGVITGVLGAPYLLLLLLKINKKGEK